MVRPLIRALCSTIMEAKPEYSASLMNLNVFSCMELLFQYCKILDLYLNVSDWICCYSIDDTVVI